MGILHIRGDSLYAVWCAQTAELYHFSMSVLRVNYEGLTQFILHGIAERLGGRSDSDHRLVLLKELCQLSRV